jgi:hypothetical protein
MKKVIQLAIVILFTTLASCKKDKEEVLAPLQNPMDGYLAASGFNQKVTNQVNLGDYEFGYSFIPMVNGKITSIIAKLPDVRSGMRVTIWDKATATVLRTELIDVASSGVEVTKAITALDLVQNKEYFITMNSNDWYDRRKTDSSPATYPITVGDIKITSYSFISGAAQAMPNSPQTTYYAGDVSFTFQK